MADVFLQLVGSLMMCRAMCRNKSVKQTFLYTAPVRFLRGLLSLFMFVWFIVGSVYVFK